MATQYGGTIRWVFEADDTQFNQAVDNVSQRAQELKEIVNSTDSSLQSTTDKIAKSTSKQGSAISDFFGSLGKSVKGLGMSALTVGATAATGAISKLVSKGIQATDFLETARTSMAGLTGSFEAGNAALSKAAEFWQNNPFDRFTTTKATQQLIQFGRQVGQVSGDLDLLGKVSLSTNTPLDELARFYARTAASGRAMTMDLEMMSDRGIPIYRELAKQLNTTTQGVRDFASQGKISFEIFQKALDGTVNEEAMEAFENTLARQKERLSGSISILAGDLGGYKLVNNQLVISEQGLEKAWTRLMKTVATALRDPAMREGMAKLGTAIASIIDKITPVIEKAIQALAKVIGFIGDHSEMLMPIIGGLLVVFGKLASQIPILNQFVGGFSNSLGGLVKTFKGLASAHPILATIVVVFGAGLVAALKNSEDFRKSIQRLLQAFAKIGQALLPVFQSLIDVFVRIVSSDAVISILEAVANTIASVAEAIASLPVEVLQAVTFAILALNVGLRTSPWVLFVSGIVMAIAALQDWIKSISGLAEIPKKIGEFFESLPKNLMNIGEQIILGLITGIGNAIHWLWETITTICSGIINTFKSVLGIHSPSTVMAEQGRYIGLGLAEGITDSKSAVQKAMANLAKDTLAEAQKVIQNKIDFDVIDVKGQYQAWQKVSELFVKGSDEYKTAIEKMEEARKQANLQIIKLQQNYNDALDNSIDRIKNFYNVFSTVSQTGGMNSTQILSNLDKQVATMQQWASAQETIATLDLDEGLVEELQNMGVDAVNELEAIAQMTSSELETLNNMWKKKQEIANNSATTLMSKLKESTLDEINEIKRGIGGETVEVREVGARLVSNITDGITGAMPTLESAYSKMSDYIANAQKELAKSASGASAGAGAIQTPENFDMDQTPLDTIKENIEKTMQNFGGTLGVGAAIAVGTGILIKYVPKIKEWFGKGKGAAKMAKSTSEAISGGMSTASSEVAKTTTSMGEMGKTVSKYEQILKKIALTLAVVIEAAVAIAAVAAAIWVVNQTIPDNIGIVIPKLFTVGLAIAGMGALAYVISKTELKDMAIGLAIIAGIAVDLALVGIGLGIANMAIPDNIGLILPKLGVMALAIAGMGALAFIAGIAWELIAPGLLVIAGIAADIALVGIAIGIANVAIPDDLELFGKKMDTMVEVITIMGGLSILGGIAFPVIMAGVASLLGLAHEIVKVSEALDAVNQNIPDDYAKLKRKVNAMMEIIKYVSGENVGGFFENLKQEWNLKPLRNTIGMIAEVSESVMQIAKLNVNPAEINSKISALIFIINELAGENIKGGNIFQQLNTVFGGQTNAESTAQKAASFFKALASIAKSIQEFPTGEIKTDKIEIAIKDFGSLVQNIKDHFPTDRVMEERGIAVDHARNLLDRVKELVVSTDNVGSFSDLEGSAQTIGSAAEIIKGIVKEFPTARTMEEKGIAVDHARNLMDRLREFASSANQLVGASGFTNIENTEGTIDAAKRIISTIAYNFPTDTKAMESKGIVVDHARNLLDRLREFVASGNGIGETEGLQTKVESAIATMNTIVSRISNSVSNQVATFVNVGSSLVQGLIDGVSSKQGDVSNAGNQIVLTLSERIVGEKWQAHNAGVQLGAELIGGVEEKYGNVFDTGKNVANKLNEGIALVNLFDSGKNATQGFVNGLTSMDQVVRNAGRQLANTFLTAFKKQAGEGSPWKTTFMSGQFAGEGLIEGLTSMEGEIVDEAETIASSVAEALDMSQIETSPSVSLGRVAPAMEMTTSGAYSQRGGVIINQNNTNYTEYDIERVNRDLSYQLAKV